MPKRSRSEAMRSELLGPPPEVRVPGMAAIDTAAMLLGLTVVAEAQQILTAADPGSDNFLP